MPGATTRTNTRATALSDEELRLMASLPGIELSVVEILKTLAALVSESADRETRLNKRVDELSRQLKDVNEELVSLRESAIALRKATPRPVQTQQGTGTGQPSRRRTKAGSSAGTAGTRKHDTTMSRSVSSNISRSGDECEEDGSVPCNISRSSDECEGDGDQDATCVDEDRFQPVQNSKRSKKQCVLQVIADDSWKMVSSEPPRAKKAVLYVGNLGDQCTEERLREFVQHRAAAVGTSADVHDCSMHESATGKISARLTVDAATVSTITAANFWPRPLYARQWRFKESSGARHDNSSPPAKTDDITKSDPPPQNNDSLPPADPLLSNDQ